jgi:hypothetical protein
MRTKGVCTTDDDFRDRVEKGVSRKAEQAEEELRMPFSGSKAKKKGTVSVRRQLSKLVSVGRYDDDEFVLSATCYHHYLIS